MFNEITGRSRVFDRIFSCKLSLTISLQDRLFGGTDEDAKPSGKGKGEYVHSLCWSTIMFPFNIKMRLTLVTNPFSWWTSNVHVYNEVY